MKARHESGNSPVFKIEQEFLKRKALNARYSLRAFARDLGMSPAQLSRVFSGKRNLTYKQAAKIAAQLSMSAGEARTFIRSVIVHAPESVRIPAKVRAKANHQSLPLEMQGLAVERFRAISQWYHLAILNMVYLKDFQFNPQWISKRIGVSESEAKQAVERLLKLGLLERSSSGRLKKTAENLFIKTERSSAELRNYELSMIEKAKIQLDKSSQKDFDRRLINGIVFPVSSEGVPEIRKMILQFQRKVLKYIKTHKFDELYTLNCQLFPLTQGEKE